MAKDKKGRTTTKSNVRKKTVSSKKKTSGGVMVSLFNKIKNFILSHKIVSVLLMFVIVVIILLILIPRMMLNKTVLTIDSYDYKVSDFNIYLYSLKYNYFGKDNTDLTSDQLETQLNSTDGITIKEYLKEQTIAGIKMNGAINKMARDNDISLTTDDIEQIEKNKESFIKTIGGQKEFKKMLKHNNTTEEAYDRMAYNDQLYRVIYDKLYSDGKKYDLTEEEKQLAKTEYYSTYKLIRQVVLLTVDRTTKESLDEKTINGKKTLAEAILKEAKDGVNFDELIDKYNEDVINSTTNKIYYTNSSLLDEIEDAADKLNVGEISDVVTSSIGFHIIKKDELDSGKLDDFYETKREDKLLSDITTYLDKISLIYRDYLEKVKIN